MRPGRIVILVAGLIALALAGIRLPYGPLSDLGAQRVSGQCTVNSPSNITCGSLADGFAWTGNYTDFINAGAGNDSMSSEGVVGDNSTSFTDGLFAGVGHDTFVNLGTVIAADGMQDGTGNPDDGFIDSLANYGLILASDSGIEGGSVDTLTNVGTITATYGLDCWSDAGIGCRMVNSGSITALFGVYAGSGNDTFYNYAGGILSNNVVMSSGNDSVMVESGSVFGLIEMGAGNDTMSNLEWTQNVDLGDGLDSLYNDDGDTIAGYVRAGTGNDTVYNLGIVAGVVSLGDGADSLLNQGLASVSSLHARINNAVYGEAGNDTIINSLNGFVVAIDGGTGNDSIRNHSLVAGMLEGGADNDTVTNFAGGLAHGVGGSGGTDSLSNGGALNSSLRGGVGQDTVTNFAGAVASWLNGDEDNDRVLNGGFVNADLNGGLGNDSVVNLAGAFVSQIYGDAGLDTVINAGFLNGTAWGGDDNDIVTNLGGAQATHISGDYGNDSVFNGGYLVGLLYGGEGNDTVVNAAFSYSAGADLGGGDDQFINGGYLNGNITCGAGNDSVSVGGYVNAAIDCGAGNDFVSIFNGVVAGQGAAVTGVINGGAGIDGLVFNFTVNVPNQAAALAISNAIAAASPAGGTITIGQVTYSWINFEALYNLLQFITIEPDALITITIPRRANGSDVAAPVAVYCEPGGVELWMVGADGDGSFGFSVPHADVNAGTTVSASGVTFTASGDGSFVVSATASDGKPYSFEGRC